MHTKRLNTFFFKWLQSLFGAIPRLPLLKYVQNDFFIKEKDFL